MVRPRHITDERLLTAAGRVVSRLGPSFTLADVAAEAQVAVGTLAQRFGSKHGLLVAMTRAAVDNVRGQMRGSVSDAGGADAVVHVLVAAYAPLDDAATAANNLAQLAADLADDELRGLMAEFYAAMEAEVAAVIRLAAGVLPGAPPAPVAARILTAVADGTAIHWSARPEGGLCDRMRADLATVLAGWRAPEAQHEPRRRAI
ncbi:TetR family transcriptional regulator [Actinoallomurus bryophytorum]|uniref:TetR family transcriptional regulator n=1 Tax=Actinoallomurus bryophytorum TaxID=1490222 RepID=A0A543CGM2_9ACTN|nr:TetR/AcrR family transcriptional regulator [Actinoallomurus bryophytorum]TQL96254.1 TetR family transcriptional regulator [Actinoallomurus bryophytorum]